MTISKLRLHVTGFSPLSVQNFSKFCYLKGLVCIEESVFLRREWPLWWVCRVNGQDQSQAESGKDHTVKKAGVT